MIPKKIHYCWFGRNPLPKSALKCIASWRKFFPDYEIIEWNEDNFDVNSIPYTAQAYEAKKYAFVSDYARFKILYEHGGIYFDTDVEVIKPFDDILAKGPFMGFEIDPKESNSFSGYVAPGLGLGVNPGLGLYKKILDYYLGLSFMLPDGGYNVSDAVVKITTRELLKEGLTYISGIQVVSGITIYPSDFFNPLDDTTGRLQITTNTHSIHWFSKTWLHVSPFRQFVSRLAHRVFGTETTGRIRNYLKQFSQKNK